MSERSLQRKLTDEGMTFRAWGETRHELALELADLNLAIGGAYMLVTETKFSARSVNGKS
jgi:hypothetical protein